MQSISPLLSELEARLQDFVQRAVERFGADLATLYLYDPERDAFYLPVGYNLIDLDTFLHVMPRTDRIAGKVAKRLQPVIADDAQAHDEMSGPFTHRERIVSSAGFPIRLGDHAAGVFFISYRSLHSFPAEEVSAIQEMLEDVADLLGAMRLFEVSALISPEIQPPGMEWRRLRTILEAACTTIDRPLALWVKDVATNRLVLRADTGLRQQFASSATVELEHDGFLAEVLRTTAEVTVENPAEDARFPFPEEAEHAGWQSVMGVPVTIGGQPMGVLAAFAFASRPFVSTDQRFLIKLANQLADALSVDRQAQVAQVLRDIGLALVSGHQLDEVLELIVDKAMKMFGAHVVTLYPYDQDSGEFEEAIIQDVDRDSEMPRALQDHGLAQRILADGIGLIAEDAEHDDRMPQEFISRHRIKSSAGFPLKVAQEAVGVMFVNYRSAFRFSEDDQKLMELFASQAALAIQNARLFQAEHRRAAMVQIARTFSDTFDTDRMLQAVVDGARDLTDAYRCVLFLFDRERREFDLEARSPSSLPLGDDVPRSGAGLTQHILDTGETLRFPDIRLDNRVRDNVKAEGIISMVGVPIQVRGVRVGVLWANSLRTNHFRARDAELLRSLAAYGAIAVERARLIESITEVNKATAEILKLDVLIRQLLLETKERFGFDCVALQLVNQERGEVETVDGIDAPWSAEARHPLDSDDIQADIIRNRRTEIIAGYDPRFDKHIYETYKHSELVRIFAPIVSEDRVLGTLEAGYQRSHRDIITSEQRQAFERLIASYVPKMRLATIEHVFETIVRSAVRMVQADSGTIHVLYKPEEKHYVYEAAAGRIGQEWLKAFPPREEGIGQRAQKERRPQKIDDPEQLKAQNPNIYSPSPLWMSNPAEYPNEEGVRSLACFPLMTNGHYEGIFYIHYWTPHGFTQDEIDLLQLFADQAAVAIQNVHVYEKLRDHSQALLSLATIGQSLSSELDLTPLLTSIARSARTTLKADLVTIYQYDQAQERFFTPPTIEGDLIEPGSMQTELHENDAPWLLVHRLRENRFAADVFEEPVFYDETRKRTTGERTFVDREKIKSSAGVLLKVRNEVVGVLFINHRSRLEFSHRDRSVIEHFASYAAVAIQQARTATRQRIQQLEEIQRIDLRISGQLDLQRLLDMIMEESVRHLDAGDGIGFVQLVDESSQELIIRAQHNLPPEAATRHFPLNGSSITALAAKDRKSQRVDDTSLRQDYVGLVPGMLSQLAVPLLQEDRLIGVLNLEQPQSAAFDDEDVVFLELVTRQAVIAIQNAQYIKRLQQLQKGLRMIATTADVQSVLDEIVKASCTLLGADDAVILPYEPQAGRFEVEQYAHYGQTVLSAPTEPPQEGGIAYAVLRKGLIAVDDVSKDHPDFKAGLDTGLLNALHPAAFAGVALKVTEGATESILGVLYIDYHNPHHFAEAELDLLRAFADQAALALQTARYIAESQQRRRVEAVSRRFNPYVVGGPIHDPEGFFGRHEVIQQIVDGVANNNYIIYGERRIGKTSLLLQLAYHLELAVRSDRRYKFLPIFASLQGVAEHEFFAFLIKAVARSPDIQQELLPGALVGRDYGIRQFEEDLETISDILQARYAPRTVRIVLLLDEMDHFVKYSSHLHDGFRRAFTTLGGQSWKMVMAGVTIQRLTQSVTSPWYNLFLELRLAPLQESVARRLIVEPVKGNYIYQNEAIGLILHYSDLKPQEVQRLCRLSVNSMLDRTANAPWTPGAGVITATDVNQAVEAALRDKTGEYHALWITFSVQKQQALREVASGARSAASLTLAPRGQPLFTEEELHAITRRTEHGVELSHLFRKWLESLP